MIQTIKLDPTDPEPMYLQIYRQFSRQIRAGGLKEGERLPSKRVLCDELKVSHSTVESAYQLLMAEGYIEALPRKGYRVLEVLDLPEKKETISSEKEKHPQEPTGLSFSTGKVDTTAFPYTSWAKLYREVLYQSNDLLSRGDYRGDRELRIALRDFLTRYRGVRVSEDQIIVAAGVDLLLDMLFHLLKPERVALEDPGYPAVGRMAKLHGIPIVPIPVDKNGIKVSMLRQVPDTHLCFVTPSHQFPAGVTMSIGRRSQLLGWADKTQSLIIEDDYDSEFRYTTRPIGALQGIDTTGRVIYLGTFSRSISPSIRVAYMVLPEQLCERYDEERGYHSCSVSRLDQQVLARFISSGMYQRHIRRTTRIYKEKKEKLEKILLEAFPNARITGNEAGLHFILHLPGAETADLKEKAAGKGLLLQTIDSPDQPGTAHLLIGFAGLEEEKIPEMIATLRECFSN